MYRWHQSLILFRFPQKLGSNHILIMGKTTWFLWWFHINPLLVSIELWGRVILFSWKNQLRHHDQLSPRKFNRLGWTINLFHQFLFKKWQKIFIDKPLIEHGVIFTFSSNVAVQAWPQKTVHGKQWQPPSSSSPWLFSWCPFTKD